MNKERFIQRLDELLRDISESERLEAIAYYREYFEDAGEDKEEEVIRELGSPEEVAHNIREELASKEIVTAQDLEEGTGTDGWEPLKKEENKKINPIVAGLLAVIGILLLITAGIPVVSTVLGIVIGIVAALFGLLVAALVVGAAFVLVSIVLLVIGIVNLIVQPVAALLLFGAAFLLFGSGLLLILAGIKICAVSIPAIIRKVTQWGSFLYRKGKVA